MSEINVVMPQGYMVKVSSNKHTESELKGVIFKREQIAHDYCVKKGWSIKPSELSFQQILEIRNQQEWIDAGK